jgi:uncharacterized protein YggU (UPF0235/DUF167 family)
MVRILLRVLTEAFGAPQRDVTLVRGEAGRRNAVRVASSATLPDRVWG